MNYKNFIFPLVFGATLWASGVTAAVAAGLPDAVEVIFDRVLNRHDVAGFIVDAFERGVKRRGLTRASRSGNQDNTVRPVNKFIDNILGRLIHAQTLQADAPGLFV